MTGRAFQIADRARRTRHRTASAKQRRYLRDLAHRADVEVPQVVWAEEAEEAIAQLERRLQPPLEGM